MNITPAKNMKHCLPVELRFRDEVIEAIAIHVAWRESGRSDIPKIGYLAKSSAPHRPENRPPFYDEIRQAVTVEVSRRAEPGHRSPQTKGATLHVLKT